jgi:hypothetical protein
VPGASDYGSAALEEWRSSGSEGPSSSGGGGALARGDTSNLADILERVLDKGIVIAGDIAINLVDVELLTIKLRLLIASVDKAREMGINWWENDPFLTTGANGTNGANGANGGEVASQDGDQPALEDRLDRLERSVDRLASALESAGGNAQAVPADGS